MSFLDIVIASARFLTSVSLSAYIDPGAGLAAIGAALALIGTLVSMAVGFVWYPLKRILQRRRSDRTADQSAVTADTQSTDLDT